MTRRRRWGLMAVVITIGIVATIAASIPHIAAAAILQPPKRPVTVPPPSGCEAAELPGDAITLKGWRCPANNRRGSVIFLHGIADNRTGVAGVASRFTARGLDVIAYDSRAHGESGGAFCTYGYHEKVDLRRVLDTLPPGPVAVIGTSLGAAIAMQTAAEDSRITTVVAAEIFSDLATVARERAPFFLTNGVIERSLKWAEQRGSFDVRAVNPADAARRISVPVMLIHGALDTDTNPEHSKRVYANLRGPKRLLLVEGAHHNESLGSGAVWKQIEEWILKVTASPPPVFH